MGRKNILEIGMAQGENIHGIILNELAVEIIGHGAVVQPRGQSFDRFIVQADIQNGFHVAAGMAIHAGPHGEQQGLGLTPSFFTAAARLAAVRSAGFGMTKPCGTARPRASMSLRPAAFAPSDGGHFPNSTVVFFAILQCSKHAARREVKWSDFRQAAVLPFFVP